MPSLPFADRISSAANMRGNNDNGEEDSLLGRGRERARRFWSGFIDFALQGNILEIAFGLIIAAAFTSLVNSFVQNIIMPPISVILPLNRNMEQKFAVLQGGPNYTRSGYTTLERAKDDGAVVLAYGSFLNQLVSFLCIGISLYGLAHIFQFFSPDPIIKHTVKCRYCRKRISNKAQRCVNCTSWQDGREDRAFHQ
ncbi:putative large conductance mechanosensitive channel protein [Colletotrichum sublineola]|uniref:Putative large conductance mechanosensitive channel protein n=1 Tax=Colletotrichum sublineola TaxID=1173701 RepID=A0A066XKI2_COLSU|nr:putative large conductance mechanosensitive channel protein [Colletotrichum sublineola]